MLCVLFVGCSNRKEMSKFKEKFTALTKLIAPHAEGPVLVRVSDRIITSSDFTKWYAAHASGQGPALAIADRRTYLQNYIREKVFLWAAEDSGIQNDRDYVRTLAQWNENQLRSSYANFKYPVSDGEISQYYQAHPSEFLPADEALVSFVKFASLSQAQKAKVLLKKGLSFEFVAKTMKSSCSTVQLVQHKMQVPSVTDFGDPIFEKTAFMLKPGEISGIVKTQNSYEILGRHFNSVKPMPLSIAQSRIRLHLQFKKMSEATDQMIAAQKIEVNDSLLSSLDLSTKSYSQASNQQ